MSNIKKGNKKELFVLLAGIGVVIMLIVIIIVVAVKTLFSSAEEEYSAIPSDLMNLNLTMKPVEEINKIDAYETDLSDRKSHGDLSFKDGLTLSLIDSSEVEERPQVVLQDTPIVADKPIALPKGKEAAEPVKTSKKTVAGGDGPKKLPDRNEQTVVSSDKNSLSEHFGKTISFSSSGMTSKMVVQGTIKACINIGGIISTGDAVQVRLLEPMGDMPRNTILTATCQMMGNRLNLVFDNVRIKVYDMDGREGLAIADSQICDGVNIIKDEAQNAVESGVSSINSTLGEGVRLINRVLGSNKNKSSQLSIEVPSAYAVYLKTY